VQEELHARYQWDVRPQHFSPPKSLRAWPNGGRMAVVVIILNEWESNPWHRGRTMPTTYHHKFDFLALGSREYGAKHGIWRILDCLDKHGVKATMVTNGLVAELFPDNVRAAAQGGHEVATHQWDQSVFPYMFQSKEEERNALVRSIEALEKASGQRVQGYMSPGPRPTPHTLELLAELGLRWTCDYIDSDLPYLLTVKGKRIVSVGYSSPGCIDYELMQHGAVQGLAEMKNSFDAMHEESKRHPMKFCYAVHNHWGGTPGMVRMMDQFLAYARQHDGVWFPRCIELADFWSQHVAA
jgi:peptidoglycan/xylan/chitin deacetylase (PgdA/CDA1 family)